ncbi:hypothetical protein KUL150_11300 [Alteromonas sp. KUL150]|uniref:hypothetical protein n=1 Tax=Alteromonas sp. KUL150 TaxID=2480805 RepID=UPI0012E51AC9|nr:hypothetical protein [Alteromonas sp. KUL150]GFD85071.1 hypothetical protein KUL150_11300 [Alteromonas sp. KUL150]
MNKKQIKDLALSNGFKLKEQPSGEMDLNPYVYDFADALLEKANERVGKLEKERSNLSAKYKKNVSVIGAFVSELTGKVIILPKMRTKEEIEKSFNKFAIEKKIEAVNKVLGSERFELENRPFDFGVRVESIEIILKNLEIELNSEQLRKEQDHG